MTAAANLPAPAESHDLAPLERVLPAASGRLVVLRLGAAGEEIEVRSPAGAVEVRITFGAAGPVVQVTGGRLEIASPGEVAIDCRDLRVNAEGDIRMNGAMIKLNCDDEEAVLSAPLAPALASGPVGTPMTSHAAVAGGVGAIEGPDDPPGSPAGCCSHGGS